MTERCNIATQKDRAMPTVQKKRMLHRLLAHHIALSMLCGTFLFLLYRALPQRDAIWKLSLVTAYAALILLTATLAIGPWNVFFRRRNPVSSDLRRDIGIWAGILCIAHTAIGLDVHLRGRPWLYFVYARTEAHWFPLRHDLFGFANDTGLIGTLLLLMLFATSNDASLRRLGTPRWKKLQRWNYAVFFLVALHGAAYQTIETQKTPFVATLVLCVTLTAAFQTTGFYLRRRQLNPDNAQSPEKV